MLAAPTTSMAPTQTDGRARAIQRVAKAMTQRHPDMAALIDRAAALAAAGGIHLTTTTATADGSNGRSYTLRPIRGRRWACTCPSYEHAQYAHAGLPLCKHSLALMIDLIVDGGY